MQICIIKNLIQLHISAPINIYSGCIHCMYICKEKVYWTMCVMYSKILYTIWTWDLCFWKKYNAHDFCFSSMCHCVQPECGLVGAEKCGCVEFWIIKYCVWWIFIDIFAYKKQQGESYQVQYLIWFSRAGKIAESYC
jgi:hypothetical protein